MLPLNALSRTCLAVAVSHALMLPANAATIMGPRLRGEDGGSDDGMQG